MNFEIVARIADRRFRPAGWAVERRDYRPESFGSGLMAFAKGSSGARLVWDGKEEWCALSTRQATNEWEDVAVMRRARTVDSHQMASIIDRTIGAYLGQLTEHVATLIGPHAVNAALPSGGYQTAVVTIDPATGDPGVVLVVVGDSESDIRVVYSPMDDAFGLLGGAANSQRAVLVGVYGTFADAWQAR